MYIFFITFSPNQMSLSPMERGFYHIQASKDTEYGQNPLRKPGEYRIENIHVGVVYVPVFIGNLISCLHVGMSLTHFCYYFV